MNRNISIIGSGSWGVALGIHLAKLDNNIKRLLNGTENKLSFKKQ